MDSGKCWLRRRRETIDAVLVRCLVIALVAAGGAAAQEGGNADAADAARAGRETANGGDAAASATAAGDHAAARETLEAFNTDVTGLTARFTQETWTVDDELVEAAAGSFALQRPGRFVWHTESPYEHVVVADGESVWMYDVELEQATRSRIDELSGVNPGSLLSGDAPVDEDYRIVSSYRLDDRELIELVPRDPRAEFGRVVVAFRGNTPVSVEIVDGLNQTTSIEFTEIEINPDFSPERFEFEPPAGVDVIGDER